MCQNKQDLDSMKNQVYLPNIRILKKINVSTQALIR
jgi:hypothetical protein